jgi:REP element-mobilizing transposase RayT
MPSFPAAFLLTWTCYGTWLHGDARGAVDCRHRTPGEPFLPPDAPRRASEQAKLRHPPVRLRSAARQVVVETLARHTQHRRWTLHALAVRTNHMHVVVSCDVHPDRARDQFKAWSTRRLREAGLCPREVDVWTEGGSDRWLWNDTEIRDAARYVVEQQGATLD